VPTVVAVNLTDGSTDVTLSLDNERTREIYGNNGYLALATWLPPAILLPLKNTFPPPKCLR